MISQNLQRGAFVFLCTLGAAGVLLTRLQHPAPPSPASTPVHATSSVPAPSVPVPAPSVPVPAPPVSFAFASPVKPVNSLPSSVPLSRAESSLDQARERWKKNSPGGVLPYLYAPIGPPPGTAKQQIGGFTVSAQASDAPNPLGQSSMPTNHFPQLCVVLSATSSQPFLLDHPWELNQNGLSFDMQTGISTEVSSAGVNTDYRGGQGATIISSPNIGRRRQPKSITIRGILRQAEDYTERLTFRTPALSPGIGAAQTQWQTQETLSGVKISLPPNALTSLASPSTPEILNLNFQIDPSQQPVVLSRSPLCQKYHQPVLLRVGAMTPTGASYDYPFSDPRSVMPLYKQPGQVWQYGPSPETLDLVVQQRVYTRQIPFALRVAVSHQPLRQNRF